MPPSRGPAFRPPGGRHRSGTRRAAGVAGGLLLLLGVGGAIGGWSPLARGATVAAGITSLAMADRRGGASAGDTALPDDHGSDGGGDGDAGDGGSDGGGK